VVVTTSRARCEQNSTGLCLASGSLWPSRMTRPIDVINGAGNKNMGCTEIDWGAVGAVATAAAVIVALAVALKDTVTRWREDRYASKMLAMQMLPALIEVERVLRRYIAAINNTAPGWRLPYFRQNHAAWIELIAGTKPELLKQAFATRNVTLPDHGSERVARAYGLILTAIKVVDGAVDDLEGERSKYFSNYRMMQIAVCHIRAVRKSCAKVNAAVKKQKWSDEPSAMPIEDFFAHVNEQSPPETMAGAVGED